MHKYWGSPLFSFEEFVCSYHNIFCSNCLFLDCWLHGFSCNLFLQFLNPQYSLISLLIFINGYMHLISLILWEMHTLWGSSYYIGLLNFHPFRKSMPMGERFRGFKGIWVCSLASLLCSLASLLFVLHGCLYSLYKPSKKGLSSITKMGEIERACVAPSMVLVINDNPYGLMLALRYSCRSCP